MSSINPTLGNNQRSNLSVSPYSSPIPPAVGLPIVSTTPDNLSSKVSVPNSNSYFSGYGLPDTSTDTSTPDNTMLYIGLGVLILIIIIKI